MPYELVNDNEQEGLLGTLGRGAARTLARGTEAVAGLPGDIVGGIAGLGNLASEKISGSKIPGFESLQSNPFTSQSIKENVTEKLTGNYLKPQGKGEELLDEIVGDLSTLLIPGGIASKGASLTGKAVARGAGKVAAGVAASQIAKGLGATEQQAGFAKLATSVLSNTLGGRSALTKQMNERYEKADFSVPNKAQVTAVPLRTRLGHDMQVIKKGASPVKNEMLEVLDTARKNIDKKGNIKVKDALSLKKSINRWFDDPKLDKETRSQFKRTVGDINNTIARYAETNPEFAQNYFPAEEMFKNLKEGSVLNKTLQNNVTFKKAIEKFTPISTIGAGLLHFNLAKPATVLGVGAGAFGAREAIKMSEFLWNSKQAQKYYWSLIKAAAAGDGATAAKDIRKIDALAAKAGLTAGGGGYQLVS